MRKLEIAYRPFDKVTRVPPGTTLFNAAHWIGLPIESTCGGRGTCGKCKIQVVGGDTEITPADRRHLSEAELAEGWRLACQAEAHDDAECFVPELMRAPKAATMGLGRLVVLEPNVHRVALRLPEPSLEDPRSDIERLRDGLDAEGYGLQVDLPLLRRLPTALRRAKNDVAVMLCGEHVVSLEPGHTPDERFGAAVDIGTTTVVGTLVDLRTGTAAAVDSTLNRQAPFGADVISRIGHSMEGPDELADLRSKAMGTVNGILDNLCAGAGVSPDRIFEMVVVGNATMLHLLLGIDPHSISVSPFVAAFREPLDLRAADVGVHIHPEGRVQTLPSIGAYVGADIVAGLLATGLARDERVRLFVDVGTNGEIAVGSSERTVTTSAPAGPAFEGSQIRCGMRASDGAIEGVALEGAVDLQVIGGGRPVGICGSGLIDAAAQLRQAGLLDPSGRLRARTEVPDHPLADRLVEEGGVRAFRLAEGVTLTQRDVRELQSAKASIATGIAALMDVLAIGPADLDEVLLAGSFGTYINPESARIIGLVPPVPVERIVAVGNAAGEGAKMALLSFREREVAFELPSRVEYVELSARPDLNESFVAAIAFPELESVS